MKNFYRVVVMFLLMSMNSYAATTPYDLYNTQVGWTTALNGATTFTETFDDDDLYEGTFYSGGFISGLEMSGGLLDINPNPNPLGARPDELMGVVDSNNSAITVNFGRDVFAFSADWDLPFNGNGSGLSVYAGDILLELANADVGFFGIVTNIAFDRIVIQRTGNTGSESFLLDNLSYAQAPTAVPAPSALWLFALGFLSLVFFKPARNYKMVNIG